MPERANSERRAAGIRVLEAQPELIDGLDDDQAALARKHLVAVLESVSPGAWDPAAKYPWSPGALGLLIIDGVLSRDLSVAGRASSELLGPGDLLRPWDHSDADGDSVPLASAWTVLEPARLAVLDERFARVACRWPAVIAGLVSRTLRRSRWMAILLGISNMTRVDERVEALMWHLADRWGRVTPEGVVVPVSLTHEMIGRLVGAHRPSVTSALGELQRRGVLARREEGGWVLGGEPPGVAANGGGDRRARGALAVDPTLAASLPALAASVFC